MNIVYAMTISLVLAVGAGAISAQDLMQDFRKGLAAAHADDFATALKEFSVLAE